MSGRPDGVTTPRPRDVPGYARAHASGLTPRVPPSPPAVSVTPTAHRALCDVGLVVGLLVAGLVVVMMMGGPDGRLSWLAVGTLLAVTTLGVGALVPAVRRWGRAQVAELQLGYTTTTFTMGEFWFRQAPEGVITHGWTQWCWDATWVLRPDGQVVRAPHPDGEPPGLYPSPRRQDALELWTGHQWTNYFPRT